MSMLSRATQGIRKVVNAGLDTLPEAQRLQAVRAAQGMGLGIGGSIAPSFVGPQKGREGRMKKTIGVNAAFGGLMGAMSTRGFSKRMKYAIANQTAATYGMGYGFGKSDVGAIGGIATSSGLLWANKKKTMDLLNSAGEALNGLRLRRRGITMNTS